jgi:putative SOS response-associated peptidase YedK
MCGRFNVIDNPELQRLLQELGIDLGLPSRANIAPTETIAMVREHEGARELAQVRWWLTPAWARQPDQKYAMFNARCETIAGSRAYAKPFKTRRGIVPVSSFIEWRREDGGRQPYLISAPGSALALAAVWDCWQGDGEIIESCSLVTTAAAPQFEQVHKRMPVMLDAGEQQRWLDGGSEVAANDPLFEPRLKQELSVRAISRQVNNARNKGLDLLAPEGEARVLAVG